MRPIHGCPEHFRVSLTMPMTTFPEILTAFVHVNVDVMKRLISVFVFSRLDYCNGILSGLPLATIAPLQRVQNAAARLVLGLSRSDHVRPALRQLHWLPVVY